MTLVAFLGNARCQGAEVLPLSPERALSRIAFGSCGKESRPQPIWKSVLAARPDIFIFAGDNIYGDTEDMHVMRAKYAKLAAKPGFQELLREVPVLATWDDHDYGKDDAGAEYKMRNQSQEIFLDFFGESKDSERRTTPGIYDAKLVGPQGKRTQIILLDTRYFRSPLNPKPQTETKITPSKGNGIRYAPQPDVSATVLGDAQWQWLEEQLRQPAELRIIVSSIQVVSEDHDSENWSNFPHEHQRLFRLIRDCKAAGVIFFSGDVHRGELSVKNAGVGYPLFDLTSSGLTQATPTFRFDSPNRNRVGAMSWGNNFGMVVVDWKRDDPEIRLQILDESGDVAIQRIIPLSLLQPGTVSADQSKREKAVDEAVRKRSRQFQEIRQQKTRLSTSVSPVSSVSFKGNKKTASHRGVYELEFRANEKVENPFSDVDFQITFVRPNGSEVTAEGFYDGDQTFRARAYCDTPGPWKWSTESNTKGLNEQQGAFQVVESSLPGKLKKHPDDPRQLQYADGKWFLHIGDTCYRYVASEEKHWREYIEQADRMGITKVRTWFNLARHGVGALFSKDRSSFDLAYWQEIDRRVAYAFEHHPHVMLQLIPFGEDSEELKRYAAGDPISLLVPRYAQSRFSAFPNVLWCISNDREIVDHDKPLTGRQNRRATIDRIGLAMAKREPWATLLTNHQSRFKGYSFTRAPWSDIITLENLDQVSGDDILKYRKLGDDPIVLDEDRYEQYRAPEHPRYYFRRLMWASLLSGGSATYGGLRTYEPHDYVPTKDHEMKNPEGRGVYGYYDAVREGRLKRGGDDFVHIHKFFADSKLTLVGMVPDDKMVGGDSARWKCLHDDTNYIIYLANPSGSEPQSDHPAKKKGGVDVRLPKGPLSARWFDPATGRWTEGETIRGGQNSLMPPASGDWILLLQRK